MEQIKTVSIGVIAYNEEKYISKLLEDIENQTYPKHLLEVILVDGMSNDNTEKIMMEFKERNTNYISVKVLKNKQRLQPYGWNIVIKNSSQDVLIRVDAHAQLPNDFVENNMKCINTGEFVCGGSRPNIIDEAAPWKKTLLSAEQSMFGSSIAPYRNSTGKRYVNSVFHGAYRREIFDKVGYFNEKLIRTEDNELHYRIRKSGYSICYDPSIVSYYHTRNSLKGMITQKYLNGFWIGKTSFVCPECISLYHLIPMVFVLSIMFSILLCIFNISFLLYVIIGFYLLICFYLTIVSIITNCNVTDVFLPIIFFLLHFSYGFGTIMGLINGGRI